MTDEELYPRYKRIAETHHDPKVVAQALAWLQAHDPETYGHPEPSHQLPLTPEKKAKIARLQAQGQIDESDYVGAKPVLDPATMGMDLYRGAKDLQSGATAGFADRLNYLTGADTPEHRASEMAENPLTSSVVQGVSGAGSALIPGSPTNIMGRGAAGLVGMAERAVPALATRGVGRAVAQTATGALAGAGLGGMQARNMGADVPTSLRAAGHGAIFGGALAGVPAAVGEAGQALAGRIKGADPNLQALEGAGYTTSPVPFRPTRRIDGGPGPSSPSEEQALPATATSRGLQGERAADAIQQELGFLRRQETHRAGGELEAATGKQGGRSLSVEPDIALIDAELAKTEIAMNPRMRAALQNARKMLTGEMEPTADIFAANPRYNLGEVGGVEETLKDPIVIHPSNPFPYRNRPGVANVEVPEPDPNYGVHSRVPYDPRPEPGRPATLFEGKGSKMYSSGEPMEQPPTGPEQEIYTPLNKRIQSIGPDVTAHAGGEEPITISSVERPGFGTVNATAGGEEPISVGIGDVRGRVGDAPNHVMDAATLNQVRDAIDTAIGTAVFETRGAGSADVKPVMPLLRLTNQMRQRIRTEAPAIGLANRRSHAVRSKFERTEKRMADNTDKPEPLGGQIASLGDDTTAAGARAPRLGDPDKLQPGREAGKNLRRNFPEGRLRPPLGDVGEQAPGPSIDELMDRPRLLGAEEAQQYRPSFRPHRNIGPLTNRLVYPVARGASFMAGEPPTPAAPTADQSLLDMLQGPPTGVPGAMIRNRAALMPELYNVLYDAQGRLLPDIRDRAERERRQ